MPNRNHISFLDDFTPLDSEFEVGLDGTGSPGIESLQLTRTESSVQESPKDDTECSGHGIRCNGSQQPCEICEKDKKEVR